MAFQLEKSAKTKGRVMTGPREADKVAAVGSEVVAKKKMRRVSEVPGSASRLGQEGTAIHTNCAEMAISFHRVLGFPSSYQDNREAGPLQTAHSWPCTLQFTGSKGVSARGSCRREDGEKQQLRTKMGHVPHVECHRWNFCHSCVFSIYTPHFLYKDSLLFL